MATCLAVNIAVTRLVKQRRQVCALWCTLAEANVGLFTSGKR